MTFRAPLVIQQNRLAPSRHDGALANLLETTLRSQDKLPFRQLDWQLPPRGAEFALANRTHTWNGLETTLVSKDALPFRQSDWQLPPRGAEFALANRSHQWNGLETTLLSKDALPFSQADWPLPNVAGRQSMSWEPQNLQINAVVPVVVVPGVPQVGNNDFWIKGYRPIGQKRRWRYWWEKDPCDIPAEIPVSEDVEEIQAEANAVSSCITDMVIQRAAEATLAIMRAYYEVLMEQITVKQQAALVEAGLRIENEKAVKRLVRKKKIMLLLS